MKAAQSTDRRINEPHTTEITVMTMARTRVKGDGVRTTQLTGFIGLVMRLTYSMMAKHEISKEVRLS